VIKCVIWDIDNTLLTGVYLEAGDQPPVPDPVLLAVLRELSARGLVHALASRNPPDAAAYVARVSGTEFAAAECGWDAKPDAVRRILADLDLTPDEVAFVDDDMLERAAVAAALPDLLVLTPDEAADAPQWPEFSPAAVTPEARRRGQLYADRRRRQRAAGEFTGSRDEFLRYAETRVEIRDARPGDLPRLHELSVRTHQLNSSGQPAGERDLAGLLRSDRHRVITVRLSDRFGDDGTVGGAVVDVAGPAWSVPLLMMSCRALGRGTAEATLAWLCRAAAAKGAAELRVPCVVTSRNVPTRLALAGAGFRAGQPGEDGRLVFARALGEPLPDLPPWVTSPGGGPAPSAEVTTDAGRPAASVTAELRQILAAVTGRAELGEVPADLPLFGAGVGLDSLTGTLLLREVHRRLDVDVAAEDLSLESLATLHTLAVFIAEHRGAPV
jgi:FkbH-like protein